MNEGLAGDRSQQAYLDALFRELEEDLAIPGLKRKAGYAFLGVGLGLVEVGLLAMVWVRALEMLVSFGLGVNVLAVLCVASGRGGGYSPGRADHDEDDQGTREREPQRQDEPSTQSERDSGQVLRRFLAHSGRSSTVASPTRPRRSAGRCCGWRHAPGGGPIPGNARRRCRGSAGPP